DVIDRDEVAEAERLREGDDEAGDEVREGALRGKADDEADDCRGREQAGGDRPHLRDDEQRGENSEGDDRGHQAAAKHLVAGGGWTKLPTRVGIGGRAGGVGLEGPSPREALFEAVPEANLILAQAPAEQDLLALSLRGEVDEPLVEVLHETARLVDPRHAACD